MSNPVPVQLKPRVLLDVDGVLADFVTPALRVVEQITGAPPHPDCHTDWDLFKDYPKEVETKFYDEFKKEGWCAALPVYPGAQDGVEALRRVADVYFVTSPMHGPHWAFERTEWLVKHFGARYDHVVHTNAKYLCKGDILVDDKWQHLNNWFGQHADGVGILWEQPYNKDRWSICTNDWNVVLQHVGYKAARLERAR